jgi:CDP-glycerol glycerophosphotransferase (TagB/SpsB family)
MVIAGMKKKKLVYLISHGHTARGLRQTDLLGKLIKTGLEVCVLAKNDPEGSLREYVKNSGAILKIYEPAYGVFRAQRKILRNYIFQNIRKNPALFEKHLRRVSDKESSIKRRLLSNAYRLIGIVFSLMPFLRPLYRSLESYFFYRKEAVDLLAEIGPSAIISTRPMDDMEATLLNAARTLKIKRVFYILSWDNITSKGIFPEKADFYLTWGSIMNQEIMEYYRAKPEIIQSCGVTHFDVHIEVKNNPQFKKYLIHLKLNPEKPYLFFTMSAPYFCPDEILIVENLAELINANYFGQEMQLVIRPHIQNVQGNIADATWLPRLEKMQSQRVKLDKPETEHSELTWSMKTEDMLKLSNLIAGANICLNSGSTISIEAVIHDKPVIITAFDINEYTKWKSVRRLENFIHLRKFYDFGGVSLVHKLEDLKKEIQAYLNDPTRKKEERKKAALAECYKLDGRATERVAEGIINVVKHGNIKP